ncbi:MAG: omptin family outer membrane protease [Treponema sp.]|jgi:outer membrane protease|nr:omptin family outer membrane protease [Treponema sp.]
MKNISAFLVLVTILCLPALAQEAENDGAFNRKESGYAVSITPQFGMLYGQAEEIVYPTDTKGEMMSQLLWDLKPLFYYGLSMELSPAKAAERWGFFSVLSLKTGIPGITGVMEDRDWLSIENGELTHYSIHDNETREMLWLDFSAGFSFPLPPLFIFKAFAGVSYMRFSFSGWDGHGTYALEDPPNSYIYKPITESPLEYDFSGKVINYTQRWLLVAPGLSLSFRFLGFFSFDLAFQISPLIFCNDLDEHLSTTVQTQYRDYMSGGIFLEPRGGFTFTATEWLSLQFEFAWRYIDGSRGTIYSKTYGDAVGNYGLGLSDSGAGLSVMDARILFKVQL